MSRPESLPEWATDANYPAGSDPWSGTPTRVEPSAGEIAAGSTPGTGLAAQLFNWLNGALSEWVTHLDDRVMLISDHFVSDPSNVWSTSTGAVVSSASRAGVYEITSGETITTDNIGLSTQEWRFRASILTSALDPGDVVEVGIIGGANSVSFKNDGTTEWTPMLNLTPQTPSTSVAPSTTLWQALTIHVKDGTATFYVDDTEIYSAAYVTALNDPVVLLNTGVGTLFVDWVDLWVND
jgi:hypothetical protein